MIHWSPDRLAALFDEQLENLRRKNFPAGVIEIFSSMKVKVVDKAISMTLNNRRSPFLPVIPETCITLFDQFMLESAGHLGTEVVGLTAVRCVEDTSYPYYIFDVEPGEEMNYIYQFPAEVIRRLNKENRRELNSGAEIIALALHTDVLTRHTLYIRGSPPQNLVLVLDNDARFFWLRLPSHPLGRPIFHPIPSCSKEMI